MMHSQRRSSTSPGRENVLAVTLDMSDSYKNFARGFFPNAVCIADKFHVLRLLDPALTRERTLATGNKRSLEWRRLLQRSRFRLTLWQKLDVDDFLARHPKLESLYRAKEALHTFYRIKGLQRAKDALDKLIEAWSEQPLPELRTLAKTLRKWQQEVLAYFATGLTNARTEGFNRKAKLVNRNAYGYRSFRNYKLRLLNACS